MMLGSFEVNYFAFDAEFSCWRNGTSMFWVTVVNQGFSSVCIALLQNLTMVMQPVFAVFHASISLNNSCIFYKHILSVTRQGYFKYRYSIL